MPTTTGTGQAPLPPISQAQIVGLAGREISQSEEHKQADLAAPQVSVDRLSSKHIRSQTKRGLNMQTNPDALKPVSLHASNFQQHTLELTTGDINVDRYLLFKDSVDDLTRNEWEQTTGRNPLDLVIADSIELAGDIRLAVTQSAMLTSGNYESGNVLAGSTLDVSTLKDPAFDLLAFFRIIANAMADTKKWAPNNTRSRIRIVFPRAASEYIMQNTQLTKMPGAGQGFAALATLGMLENLARMACAAENIDVRFDGFIYRDAQGASAQFYVDQVTANVVSTDMDADVHFRTAVMTAARLGQPVLRDVVEGAPSTPIPASEATSLTRFGVKPDPLLHSTEIAGDMFFGLYKQNPALGMLWTSMMSAPS